MEKKRILIVEDVTIVSEDIKKILTKNDYEVIDTVTTGAEALEIINREKPDLVLLDIMLEDDINGIQVGDRIVHRDIPFIYLTAYSDDERIEQAKLTMPFGYLLKPFRERELVAAIRMAFYKHEMDLKLKESMENYKRILDNIQDIYYEVTVDGLIHQISPSIETLSSYTSEDLINHSIYDFYYNFQDRDVFLAKLTKDGSVLDYPLILKDKDGTPFTCICSAKIINDKEGESKIIGSLRNISEHLLEKEARRDSEEKYRLLFESNPEAVLIHNENRFIDCNEAALKLFQISDKSILKEKSHLDLSPALQPDNQASARVLKKYIQQTLNKGTTHFSWTYQKQDGSTFPALVWLNSYDHNDKRYLQVNIKDISDIQIAQNELQKSYHQMDLIIKERTSELVLTNQKLLTEIHERKTAERRAVESEEFYNALFENNPVETIVVDKNGTILRFNLAVKKNRSRPPRVGDIMYKDYANKHENDMYGELIDSIKTGKSKHFAEVIYTDKIWSITMTPFEKGAIIVALDISERKHTEKQIMKLNSVFQNLSSDPTSNIDYIVHQAGEIIDCSCCLYLKYSKASRELSQKAGYNSPEKLRKDDLNESNICVQELILAERASINFNDLSQTDYTETDPILRKFGFKSLLGFPVCHQHNTIGVLALYDSVKRQFTNNEMYILSTLAKTISIEEERLSVLTALKQVTKLQQLILKTARSINSSLDFAEVTKRITTEVMELLNSYGGAVYLLEADGRTLKPTVVIDPDFADEIMATELDIDNCFTGQSIKQRKPLIFNDAGQNEIGFQIPGTTEEQNERILVAPFISEDEVLGAICLNRIGPVFTEEDLALLETLASFATSTLKNAQTFNKLKREIAERAKAELAREESEKKYSSLHANVPVGVFKATPQGKLQSVNPTMVRMLGYKNTEDLLDHETIEFYHNSSDREKLMQILNDEGEVENFEVKLRRADGTSFWSSLSVKVNRQGGKWIYQDGIIKDITKRKEAEIRLMKTQNRLVTLFQNVPDLILYETGGKEEFVSSNIKELLGYPPESFTSDPKLFESLIHEEDRQYIREKYDEWIESGKEQMLTLWFRVKNADGNYIWMEDRRVKITDEANRSYESGVKIDITNLKKAEENLKTSLDKLKTLLEETVDGLVSAVEMRDPYTAGHQRRVAILASAIAREMGLTEDQIDGINMAALVHDIGKINVPAEILSKPGLLTETEFNLIKMHPQTGYEILKSIQFPWPVAEIVLQHQERFDGSAYPQGLKGEEINLKARILSVADVIEAMSSHRPYRPSLGIDSALEEIRKNRGKFYDPDVVDACLSLFEEKKFMFTEQEELLRN